MVIMNGDEFTRRSKDLNMTTPALCERLGISRMTFYRWRKDGVPVDRKELVDLALHCLAIRCDELRPAGERLRDMEGGG